MDKDYRLLPITFERGIQEFYRPSMIPVGAVTRLHNWEPSGSGELRVRVPWLKGSTTSAPSTRKNVGTGYFSRSILPSIVQISSFASGTSTSGSITVQPFWPTATTKGNLLLLVLTLARSDGSTTFPSPTGWTSAVLSADTNARPRTAIYYIENAESTSGVVSLTVSGFVGGPATAAGAALLEVQGIATSSSVDKTASTNSGGATGVASGTTSATAQAVEFVIASLADLSTDTYSAVSNSFNLVFYGKQTADDYPLAQGIAIKTTTATGTQTTTGTTANSEANAGAIATFKGWYTATPSAGQTRLTEFLVAQNDTTEYDLFKLDRENLAAGTWTARGSITASDPTQLVAMTPGSGRTWITNAQFGSLYQYNGVTTSAIVPSPAGKCIAFHKNRVWTAGVTGDPGRLRYSEIGDGETWPILNYIDVEKNSGEPIEDITPFQDVLIIGTRTGLWTLSGAGPDTFVLNRLPTSTGIAPGRTIIPTPYGAVCAGRSSVQLLTEGILTPISKPISSTYGLTGDFMAGSFIDDSAYILDITSGVTWVINLQTGTWREERFNSSTEQPAFLYNHDNMQVYGPKAATIGSLLNYRLIPGTTRGKDFDTLTETFSVRTPEIWPVGPEFHITPRHLFLKIRQLGGNSTQTGLTVTPYYNGEAAPARTITPRSSAGVYRERLDLGEMKGINYTQFYFDQTLASGEATAVEIEEATFGFFIEEKR
jgi:hypothetical protein